VRGLDAGADDYLKKPLDRNELRARLKVGKRILTLQRDLIQAREDLRFQANHDALTGILNRRTILDLLHRELERAAREQSVTGILMLDLDHFKRINDTYGRYSGSHHTPHLHLHIILHTPPGHQPDRKGIVEDYPGCSHTEERYARQ
jgi:two-component system cell cycle response regulator